MIITGTVKRIGQIQQVSEKFKKLDLVITTEDTYPQTIQLQFGQDKCSLADNLNEGDKAIFSINIRGREWTNPKNEVVVFNTIECWKVEVTEKAIADDPAERRYEVPPDRGAENNDLPF